jgi:hypothetical protein
MLKNKILPSAIGEKSEQMAVLHKLVLQDMLTDTLGVQADSVLWFMARLENIPNLYSLAMAHLEMGDADDGKDVLDFIPVLFPKMDVQEIEELDQMKALYAIHRAVREDGRNEARMTPVEVGEYLSIAETPYSGRAGGQAWNTLCFFYNMCPDANGMLEERSYQAYSQPYGISNNANINPVNVYPNPANDYTTLSYELFSAHPQTTLRITDVNGREIITFTIGESYNGQQLWDTRGVKSGVYMYQLVQNNKQIASGKVIVQH